MWRRVILWMCLALVSGCATQGPTRKAATDWHDAVVAVREQSVATFRGVNQLVRDNQLRRAVRLSNLKEEDFHPGLDAASLAIWNQALDSLAEYSGVLSALLDPAIGTGVEAAAKGAAESIATTAKSDLLTRRPGLAGALGSLGARLAAKSASRSAREIMNEADSAVGDVLDQMAKMISDGSGSDASGVRPTVRAAWMTQAAEARADFLQPGADKAKVAARYAAALDARDAADATLLALRRSLVELRVAHRRAASGDVDTSALVASVREDILFVKGLVAGFKPAAS